MAGVTLCRHPLFAAVLLWLVVRDPVVLTCGVFFELLWMDLFYVGAYVPPMGLLSFCAFYAALTVSGATPQTQLWLLVCSLPLASLGARLENRIRHAQDVCYHTLMQSVAQGRGIEAKLETIIGDAFALQTMLGFGLCFAAVLVLTGIAFILAQVPLPPLPFGKDTPWPYLWCLASMGALAALRLPMAVACFAACCIAVGAVLVF